MKRFTWLIAVAALMALVLSASIPQALACPIGMAVSVSYSHVCPDGSTTSVYAIVRDQGGMPLVGQVVTFTVTGQTYPGSIDPNQTYVTDTDGFAKYGNPKVLPVYTSGSSSGSVTITATDQSQQNHPTAQCTVEATYPPTPSVTDDGEFTGSTSSLHAAWTHPDLTTSKYAIGTTSGAADVVGWTYTGSFGTDCSVTKTGLSLQEGPTYFFSVMARSGNCWGSAGNSDGIKVDTTAPAVAITMPAQDGFHAAKSASVRLSMTASDSGSGVNAGSAKFVVDSTEHTATYDSGNGDYYYNWTPSTTGTHTIQAKASDNVGNEGVTSARDVEVVSVKYVTGSGTDNEDSGRGDTWNMAYGTIQYAIDHRGSSEIWVAATISGAYLENIVLDPSLNNYADGTALYGGFSGAETVRECRDWVAHETFLDANGSGSVVTINNCVNADTRIDGFTIHHASAAGISCSGATATIADNIICYNGGGLYAEDSSLTVTGNVFVGNSTVSAWGAGGGIGLFGTASGVVANNTIVGNSATSFSINSGVGEGGGIFVSGGSAVTLSNNIVAFNTGGGIAHWYGDGPPTCHTNDVFGNSKYQYSWISLPQTHPDGDIEPVDPGFNYDSYWHIRPDSPCIDTGTNGDVSSVWDIDGESRIHNGVVDIGADESDGCGWYTIIMSCDPTYAAPQGSVDVTVHVTDWINNDVEGAQVTIAVTDGSITQPVSGTEYTGSTDANGDMTVTITRNTVGYAKVTASVARPCGSGSSVSSTMGVWFTNEPNGDDWPMFQHDVAHTGVTTTSLGSNLQRLWDVPLEGKSDGSILWSFPVVADGAVFVGTNTGMLYSFDTIDGSKITEKYLGLPIHGTPCVVDGKVYVGTENGVLHVLNAADLSTDWTKTFPGESITGGITVWNGAAYVPAANKLHTIDLSTHDDRDNSPAIARYAIKYTTPAIDTSFSLGARCYVSDYSCWVTAAQCSDGLWKWEWHRDESSIYSSPTIYNGYIFVGSHVNGMYRIIDGGSNYQEPNPYMYTGAGTLIDPTAAVWQGKLYFGAASGNVCRIDTTSFTTADWTTDLGVGGITSSPLISSPTGLLFTGTDSGAIYVVDTANGSATLLYDISQDIESPTIKSSPAAAGGQLFIVAGNATGRRLYCFGQ